MYIYTIDYSRSYAASKRVLRASKQNAKLPYSWSTSPSAVFCTWVTPIGELVKILDNLGTCHHFLPGLNSRNLDCFFQSKIYNQTTNASQGYLGLKLWGSQSLGWCCPEKYAGNTGVPTSQEKGLRKSFPSNQWNHGVYSLLQGFNNRFVPFNQLWDGRCPSQCPVQGQAPARGVQSMKMGKVQFEGKVEVGLSWLGSHLNKKLIQAGLGPFLSTIIHPKPQDAIQTGISFIAENKRLHWPARVRQALPKAFENGSPDSQQHGTTAAHTEFQSDSGELFWDIPTFNACMAIPKMGDSQNHGFDC